MALGFGDFIEVTRNYFLGLLLYRKFKSETLNPVSLGLPPKPCPLAFRVLPSMDCRELCRGGQVQLPLKDGHRFFVSDRLKGLGCWRNALLEKASNLVEQSGGEHGLAALLDPQVQGGSGGIEDQFEGLEALEFLPSRGEDSVGRTPGE